MVTDALGQLFSERLAGLEPDVLGLVSTAALLGYRFEARLAASCAGLSRHGARRAFERARSLGLVVREARVPAAYRFRHALVQVAVRDGLSPECRRLHHARIAAVLEALPDAPCRTEQLAHHWLAAGDAAKAALYCERAAQDALRLGALGDAAAWRARVS